MAFTFLLIVTVFLIQQTECNVVDDLSCANHVHDECKQCDFNEMFVGDNEWSIQLCRKLQACGECLSVPRCPSKYIQRFINLLLITLKISKNFCPDLEYRNLSLRQEGSSVCRGVNHGYRNDECGQRCTCENGVYIDCVRIRKEFTQMTFGERRRFVNVYYKATTDPHYRDEFAKILNIHPEIPSNFLHHMPQIFFPWHRWYLLKIENFLRRIDCRITVPYYDWSVRASDGTVWRTSDPTDVWNSGPHGIGGNGVAPSRCVEDGKFREGNWKMPRSKGGECLKRNFSFKCKLHTEKMVKKMMKKSFQHFENEIREEMHARFHDCIGGNMIDPRISSFAPEFIFHHGFIDKLWSTFQKRGLKYKFAYYPSVNFRMPFADMYPLQFLENDKLPGDVKVKYEEMKKENQDIEIDEEEYEYIK